MIAALGTGIVFGLSAGLAPGPLLALAISQTVRHGLGHGLRVAAAPLLTDLPIVAGATFLVGTVAASGWPLAAVALAGAIVVARLALETWRAGGTGADLRAPEAPRSWTRGVVVNLLSPHPYLFWLAVGAPALLAAARADGPLAAAAFVAGFYGCLVGSKAAIAAVTARTGPTLGSSRYTLAMRFLGLVLALLAVRLLVEGLTIVGPLVRS